MVWAALWLLILIAVLIGSLPSTLSTAVLAAAALCMRGASSLSIAVLAMNTTATMGVQERIADALHGGNLEAAAPAVVAIAILVLAQPRLLGYAVIALGLAILSIWLGNELQLSPPLSMAIAALPAVGVSALVAHTEVWNRSLWLSFIVASVLFVAFISWAWTPPRHLRETQAYVILPDAPDNFEAKFYTKYSEALAFAGIRATHAARPEDVPPGSLLLLPWLTAPFSADTGDPLAKKIRDLAQERSWTVVALSEHTNMGGVADRIATLSGEPLLRNDLTVPPGNTDASGPLHASDLRQWPHEANLNRGASVRSTSFVDRILLAGDGWWAEPDIGEWLWVGDYAWVPGDRTGRLALAVSTDIGDARWVVIGDNTPFINNQLIADPRPPIRLLELASLWPAFLRDLFLLAVGCALFVRLEWHPWKPLVVAASLLTVAIFVALFGCLYRRVRLRRAKLQFSIGRKPSTGRRLIRIKPPVSGVVNLPEGNSVIFMLVDGSAEIGGGVKLSQCHRMGSLKTAEGPYLMDAQACRVEGSPQVLIGSSDSAAAFRVSNGKSAAIVLLDVVFLGQKAPGENAKWLVNEVK